MLNRDVGGDRKARFKQSPKTLSAAMGTIHAPPRFFSRVIHMDITLLGGYSLVVLLPPPRSRGGTSIPKVPTLAFPRLCGGGLPSIEVGLSAQLCTFLPSPFSTSPKSFRIPPAPWSSELIDGAGENFLVDVTPPAFATACASFCSISCSTASISAAFAPVECPRATTRLARSTVKSRLSA